MLKISSKNVWFVFNPEIYRLWEHEACSVEYISTDSFCVDLSAVGWSGSGGLGAKEQGIQDPIKGGDIRDKWDQYKGVGVSLDDPYENYRRNKSYNFVARMKAREEGTLTAFKNLNKGLLTAFQVCSLSATSATKMQYWLSYTSFIQHKLFDHILNSLDEKDSIVHTVLYCNVDVTFI